jgi:enamine deaminase RidA (YjgF/YER057c/UK114 family)
MNTIINPPELPKPSGYAHAVAVDGGRTVYLGGQISCDGSGAVVNIGDIVGQFSKTLDNIRIALQAAGGEMTDIVKMTIFVKDRDLYKEHLKEIGAVYRTYFGKYYPAMTLAEVTNLYEDLALIEIESIAVIQT